MRAVTCLLLVLGLQIGAVVAAELKPIALAIHGGAGTINPETMTAKQQQQIQQTLDQALQTGYRLLNSGASSVTAVEAAVQVLEDSPLFNAGRGAVYTWDETHELDAAIMRGQDRQAGAVAGVTTIKNPISAAIAVMNRSPHVLLSGSGADQFAKEKGLDLVSNNYFDTEKRYQQLLKAKQKIATKQKATQQASYRALPLIYRSGTVGAVALDRDGNLAAGTSTGGMTAKRYGRIGDAPIIGAGTFADNRSCAVSATGHGEYFIRYNVAADICARVEYQQASLADAARTVINDRLLKVGGDGGVIAISPEGAVAMPFNSQGMYRASIDASGHKVIAIWKQPLVNERIFE